MVVVWFVVHPIIMNMVENTGVGTILEEILSRWMTSNQWVEREDVRDLSMLWLARSLE